MHAHCIIFLLFFFVFFLSFFFFLAFLLSFYFIFLSCSSPVFRSLFWAQWRSSYSTCHDHILLFCPLTTFVWSECTCRSCVYRGLKAFLHGLLLFFILFHRLFHNSLHTLRAGLPLILGFIFLSAHFLVAIMFCHIVLSFLL